MRLLRRLRNLLLLASLVFVAIAAGAGPAAATYPGANGRIVFANGTNELWSVLPDATGLELLTTVVAPAGVSSFVSFPSFSADGSKLAVMLNERDPPTAPTSTSSTPARTSPASTSPFRRTEARSRSRR